MNRAYDIVILGDINMDWVGRKSLSFSFADLVTNGVIEWAAIDELPGGSGLNFAHFAYEEGYVPLLLGKIGADSAGAFIKNWLKEYSLDDGIFETAECGTGKAFIIRDKSDIRFLVNNQPNANTELSPADINQFSTEIITTPILYISGYCAMYPDVPRKAALDRAVEIAQQDSQKWLVFDVVPHQIYNIYNFAKFLDLTRHVNILISEVATMRRFLGLGDRSEKITAQEVNQTAHKLTDYYPNFILRYGPSGCDYEYIWNGQTRQGIYNDTDHKLAADKRGFGDRLTIKALKDYFNLKPRN